ncbi:GGDEF domain-containing protein [Pseudobutyrivibrio xylanivorans]|uniref:Diguanylate cyclase (GGDEF) domain-containing protein n=1 Tax=Pseudobutyrivibrio xylanivorans TaxID=185007 RepID=A0A1G5S5I1_PSEXY|nr:GGDEF domain-containing protein [Pseudobutyrivibrio xylanivorans]SCZ81662.1 diguanylate cyclase (GGDEF) domain-containing protein [Pseudobutyrivibrio xylanivorans]
MNRFRKPLKRSIFIGSMIFILVLCLFLNILTYSNFRKALYSSYEERITDILVYVHSHIDLDDLSHCVDTLEESEKYKELMTLMDDVVEQFNIHYLYIITPLNGNETDNMLIVLSATTEYEREYHIDEEIVLGYICHDDYSAEMAQAHLNAMNKDEISFQEERSSWGDDYTGFLPLIDSKGKHFALLCVDIDIAEIHDAIQTYTTANVGLIAALGVLFMVLLQLWLNENIITPLTNLEKSVSLFAEIAHDQTDPTKLWLDVPPIHTQNEVEGLYNAISQMSQDMHSYVMNITNMEEKVSNLKTQVNYMDMLAYQDSLTKVKNKAWYDKTSQRVNEEIEEGTAEFAIIMADLNYLKKINDTYGHERGNEYIFGACKEMCQIFSHSPIFRIGGDEFVILLEKLDYMNRNTLLAQIELVFGDSANNTSKEPWQRYSVALGMAIYAPETDKTIEDVFKRADKTMYENKILMKAARE